MDVREIPFQPAESGADDEAEFPRVVETDPPFDGGRRVHWRWGLVEFDADTGEQGVQFRIVQRMTPLGGGLAEYRYCRAALRRVVSMRR